MTSASQQPLGRRLSMWRSAEKLSYAAAARRFRVHPSTYQRWEVGQRPYPRHLSVIASVLGDDLATVAASAGPPLRRLGRRAPDNASVLMKARLAAGLNRVELGRLLHVGPATVYEWERGNTRPPQDLLPDLARHLRLTRPELDDALSAHPPSRHDGEILPWLARVLRDRGWPRNKVRSLLGASPSSVFEWETGRTRTPSWAIRRLELVLGIEYDDLVFAARSRTVHHSPEMSLGHLRRRVRMTQREAAAVLGVSPSSLSRYEAGRRPIDLPLARAVATAYRVPLSRVLDAAGLKLPPLLLTPRWTNDQLPAVLADLRQAAGASLSEVARCTGVSHPTVRRWETGDSVPSAGALATLERRYQLGSGRLTSLGTTATRRPPSRDHNRASQLIHSRPSRPSPPLVRT